MASKNYEKIDTEKVCQNDGPKGRKGVENGAKMDPKTMKKSMQKSMPKTDRKNIEKT